MMKLGSSLLVVGSVIALLGLVAGLAFFTVPVLAQPALSGAAGEPGIGLPGWALLLGTLVLVLAGLNTRKRRQQRDYFMAAPPEQARQPGPGFADAGTAAQVSKGA